MPTHTSVTRDLSAGHVIDVPCTNCHISTKHIIIASADVDGTEVVSSEFDYGWRDTLQIIQCRGCETVSFRHVHSNSEDGYYGDNTGFEPYEDVKLCPNRDEERLPMKDIRLLPINVMRIYDETLKALNSDLSVLTGIGVRALLETICKDKNAPGSDLYKKIDALVTTGVLTREGAQILHKIRSLGNKSAHEVKPHSSAELVLALDVIEHVLQGVYVLPHHVNNTFK
jgi:hypothetical protein